MGVLEPLAMFGFGGGELALDNEANKQATQRPSGGGVSGLSSADMGKTGIPSATQEDPGPAMQMNQKAAQQFEQYAKQGLQYYEGAIDKAHTYINNAVNISNAALEPYSYTGITAMNQYMTMLGLKGLSPTRFDTNNSNNIWDQIRGTGYMSDTSDNYLHQLTTKISAAEDIRDPEQRRAAKTEILGLFDAARLSYHTDVSTKLKQQQDAIFANYQQAAALGAANQAQLVARIKSANAGGIANENAMRDGGAHFIGDDGAAAAFSAQGMTDTGILQRMAETSAYTNVDQPGVIGSGMMDALFPTAGPQQYLVTQRASAQTQADAALRPVTALDQQRRFFEQNYSDNPDYFGKTAAERDATLSQSIPGYQTANERLGGSEAKPLTLDELKNTPGYQFMYDQGLQSTLAAGAAGGMLSSGNTMTAAARYAEGLAQQVYQYENDSRSKNYQFDQQVVTNDYNNYMQSLLNPYNIGFESTKQVVNNYMTQGQVDAGLEQSRGQAGLDTYTNIGDHYFKATTKSASDYNQVQGHNMDAQNQMILSEFQARAGAANAATGQLGSLAQTAGNMSNQQSMANGYNGGGTSSGGTSGNRWSLG